ncbi:hypothetical protein Acr_00g0083310 [Actinidia rufa]|uniref:Uncharacterized protein n=1 Tax=Actinidia rufa TaxID=165716 RepID=A0A7J0DW34_9ERIC|nr:hypothetical protein Acr_00g0083310 [Actinidia rufa]
MPNSFVSWRLERKGSLALFHSGATASVRGSSVK